MNRHFGKPIHPELRPSAFVMTLTTRHLEKLTSQETEKLTTTGEDMHLLIETLRDLKKLRTVRQFLYDTLDLHLDLSPSVYHRLLKIPEIDMIETPTKTGDIERISIKTTRQSEDPVSAADLNRVLRELNRDLIRFQEHITQELPKRLLAQDITADRIEPCIEWVKGLKTLHDKRFGYLLSPFKIKKIENTFRQAFPNSTEAHLLRSLWPKVEYELGFYRVARKIEEKWSPLSLNLLAILKMEKLSQALQNVQEMGSLLWKAVYNGHRLNRSFEILKIRFNDTRTFFENNNLK